VSVLGVSEVWEHLENLNLCNSSRKIYVGNRMDFKVMILMMSMRGSININRDYLMKEAAVHHPHFPRRYDFSFISLSGKIPVPRPPYDKGLDIQDRSYLPESFL
jgi:hypothetical protein